MNQFKFIVCIVLFGLLSGCYSPYDPELMQPDGHGSGYNLTPLGCFVNGPWEASNDRYNKKILLNDSEILSQGAYYSEFQKNLAFELYKDGRIEYWLKTNNTIKNKPADSKQIHSSGNWKYNMRDSTFIINFKDYNIQYNFKYANLGSSDGSFQRYRYFDSMYNGKKVKFKEVNTFYYRHLYPTL